MCCFLFIAYLLLLTVALINFWVYKNLVKCDHLCDIDEPCLVNCYQEKLYIDLDKAKSWAKETIDYTRCHRSCLEGEVVDYKCCETRCLKRVLSK